MIQDDTAVNEGAGALFAKLSVEPQDNDFSKALNEGAAEMAKLESLDGQAFDREYARNELAYHQAVNHIVGDVWIPNILPKSGLSSPRRSSPFASTKGTPVHGRRTPLIRVQRRRNIMTRKASLVLLLSAGVLTPADGVRSAPVRTLHVEIHDFEFVLRRIEAHVGDTIEFTNRDFAPHTATDDAAKWDTQQIGYGKLASIVAASAGSFAFHCRFHPRMKGLLVITPR